MDDFFQCDVIFFSVSLMVYGRFGSPALKTTFTVVIWRNMSSVMRIIIGAVTRHSL